MLKEMLLYWREFHPKRKWVLKNYRDIIVELFFGNYMEMKIVHFHLSLKTSIHMWSLKRLLQLYAPFLSFFFTNLCISRQPPSPSIFNCEILSKIPQITHMYIRCIICAALSLLFQAIRAEPLSEIMIQISKWHEIYLLVLGFR